MGSLFNLQPRATKAGDSLLAKKASTKAKPSAGISVKGGGGMLERIATINALVEKNLGKYRDRYAVIREEWELKNYVDLCIENGVVAIDTESGENALDPITCHFAGFSLYTPNQKAVYIPVHHVSYITGAEVDNQLSEEFVATQLQRFADECNNNVRTTKFEIEMFNAKYDTRVIWHKLKVRLKATWDAYIAARLLNENSQENGLKALHNQYCLDGKGDAWSFNDLFKGIPFTHIPINTGYIYAARDPEITHELCEFQRPFLCPELIPADREDLLGVAYIFHNIEMPLIPVTADMEDTGVAIDFEYAQSLSEKYDLLLKEKEKYFYDVCDQYKDKIDKYKVKAGASCKLGTPINIGSPQQMAILLYDILGLVSMDKNAPRGTGDDAISGIDHPICKAILDYRGIAILLKTFIDKIPAVANEKTRRVHASFNQVGTVTGRYSSSEPNLQNIPSHNTEIRKMFKATDGYVFIGGDYSAQEPRITSHLSNDEKMIQAYRDGKDVYVEIASLAFNMPYDECSEFRPDGTKNPEGKDRRGKAKAIVLGICYGKGIPAIAEDLNVPVKKAQEIFDKVMNSFPGLRRLMEDSENMARDLGYVTTIWGRKRRLPDIQLPPYEFSYIEGKAVNFDPLDFEAEDLPFDEDGNPITKTYEVDDATVDRYTRMLNNARYRKQKIEIIARAKDEGIHIKDNGGFIAEAIRQCVNSRVQGSAADMTKIAMILIGNNKRLKELGFRLLLAVHDELIGECPKENAREALEIFESLLLEAGSDLKVPVKCDLEVTDRWFGCTVVEDVVSGDYLLLESLKEDDKGVKMATIKTFDYKNTMVMTDEEYHAKFRKIAA